MSQSPSDLRTQCQNFARSGCQNRIRFAPDTTRLAVYLAFVPIWGFGQFNASSTYGSLIYDDTWPVVYDTLTEVWTETNPFGGGTRTTTSVYAPYLDAPFSTSTVTTGVFFGPGSILSFTAGLTSCSATYGGGLVSGTYTATLTGLYSTSWEDATLAAEALLSNLSLPTDQWSISIGAPTANMKYVVPIQASPGYQILDYGSGGSAYIKPGTFFTAAARGLPVRLAIVTGTNFPPNFTSSTDIFALQLTAATICSDHYGLPPGGSYSSGFYPNSGGCICVKAAWQINGNGASFGRPSGTSVNQTELWMQTYDSSGGGSYGASAQYALNPFVLSDTGSYEYLNPFSTQIPELLLFEVADVTAMLNATPHFSGWSGPYSYGILDFYSTLI
jgi:hypothetical protein